MQGVGYGGNLCHSSRFPEIWLIVLIFLADQASCRAAQNPAGCRDLQANTDVESDTPLMHPDNTSAFQKSGSWSCPGWRAKLFCQEQPYSKFERTKSKWDQTKPHDLIVNVRKALLECVLPAPCSCSIQVFIQVWYWGVLAREDLRCPLDFYITALTLAAQIGCWCSCGWWNN